MSLDKVQLSFDDLQTKIETISAFKNKVVRMYSIEQLTSSSTHLSLPAVAIIYEALTPIADKGKARMGRFGIYLVGCPGEPSAPSAKAIPLLKQLRDAILDTKSPSGHTWEFLNESVVDLQLSRESGLTYRQQWSTRMMGI